MKKVLFSLILTTLMVAGICQAQPILDPWADEVILFDQPEGSNHYSGNDNPANALGARDNVSVSVDIPEVLIIAFTDNTVFDGVGNDLIIYQCVAGDSYINIYGSSNNSDYVFLGKTSGDIQFDLANYPELNTLSYLKFVGYDNGGTAPGYDLDAAKALNCGPAQNIATVPAPAAIMLAMMGISCVRLIRKNK